MMDETITIIRTEHNNGYYQFINLPIYDGITRFCFMGDCELKVIMDGAKVLKEGDLVELISIQKDQTDNEAGLYLDMPKNSQDLSVTFRGQLTVYVIQKGKLHGA